MTEDTSRPEGDGPVIDPPTAPLPMGDAAKDLNDAAEAAGAAPAESTQPSGLTPEQAAAREQAAAAKLPPTPPPAGGPADPASRTVTPIAHETVVLPPNPPAARKPGVLEIVIGVLGLVTLGSTFLTWVKPDTNAWPSGLWIAGVLGVLAAVLHLIRSLPAEDKAVGALLPLILSTAAVWVPIVHLRGNLGTVGTWVCLGAGVVLTGALLIAAMSDPALRRADNPNDLLD